MKNLLCILLCLISLQSFGSTNVSGTIHHANWTVANSPYLVQGDIRIDSLLTIEPGVEVIVQGFYLFKVYGAIQALGAPNDRITFSISDTTGWSDTSTSGGWPGFYLRSADVLGDTNVFKYCDIKDLKWHTSLGGSRPIHIYECNFLMDHCTMHHVKGERIFDIRTKTNVVAAIRNSEMYNSLPTSYFVFSNNGLGGQTLLESNFFHHIDSGGVLWSTQPNLSFVHNEVSQNNSNSGLINISNWGLGARIGNCLVEHNIIHHNNNYHSASIALGDTRGVIQKNFISNNLQRSASCPISGGGAAINVADNIGTFGWDSLGYVIRDNIIVNNRALFYGGGVSIYGARAQVINNTILNNSAATSGSGIAIRKAAKVGMFNNIISNNFSDVNGAYKSVYISSSQAEYEFDYNWIGHSVFQTVSGGILKSGSDTSHNVNDTSPLLVNPTSTALYTENALNKDFRLLSNSTCIDNGTNSQIELFASDFYDSLRIWNSTVDIGAIEYGSKTGHPTLVKNTVKTFRRIYPNPVSNNGTLHIELNELVIGNIKLYSSSGRLLLARTIEGKKLTVDLNNVNPGLYILILDKKNGKSEQALFLVKD